MPVKFTGKTAGDTLLAADWNTNWELVESDFADKTVEGQIFSAAAAASTQRGVVNIGSGGFTGGANHFAGHASGTQLAINAPSGFAGNLLDAQVGGSSQFQVTATGLIANPTEIHTLDTGGATIVFPLLIRHGNTAGAGAAGIGAGVNFDVESATEGSFHSVGSVSCYAVDNTLTAQYGEMRLRVPQAGTNDNVVLIYPRRVRVPQSPTATANYALLNVGHGGFDGSGGHFAGNANGTCIAANLSSGHIGDLINLQTNGVSRFRVTGPGAIGFNGATPITKPTITGSRGGNAALASLLTQLANYGLITDGSSA